MRRTSGSKLIRRNNHAHPALPQIGLHQVPEPFDLDFFAKRLYQNVVKLAPLSIPVLGCVLPCCA